MAYTKYSLTPANNNAAPPDGAPEGMLPSAVNDTMRDMMAQIRDVGDGIRGGTYTMTAPVITGGSITGVALSGNTLTNPVITGGSINNTPIGASTASTGAFTTLSASSTISGSGFSSYLASPPAIGGSTPAAISSTNLAYTGTLTGGTGVVNLGSGQFYKDASGNLGLGTASPAQLIDATATNPRIKLTATSTGYATSQFTNTSGNSYFGRDDSTGSFFGIANGTVVYSSSSNPIGFYTGATERMRIGSTGQLDVTSADDIPVYFRNATNVLRFRPYVTSLAYSQISALNAAGAAYTPLAVGGSITILETGGTERMRIDSSGNCGIGTSSPSGKLQVYGASGDIYSVVTSGSVGYNILASTPASAVYTGTSTNHPLVFITNNTERMRIDSSGNLLVGTTTAPAVARNASAFSTNYWQYGASTTGSSVFWVLNSSNTGVSLTSGNTSWAAQSDERTKDIIEPIGNALNKVDSLRAVIGKYKTDKEGTRRSFLIAQDVQKVLPEVIDTDTDEQGTLSIRYTEIIPLLVASIKELNAEVQALKQQLGK